MISDKLLSNNDSSIKINSIEKNCFAVNKINKKTILY